MQASFTGGAPGTPTYAWSFVAPVNGGANFQNPLNASSQIVRYPSVSPNQQINTTVRVTVTDSAGNVSTQDANVRGEHTTNS